MNQLEVIVVIFIVVLFLVFALVGFVNFVMWLFTPSNKAKPRTFEPRAAAKPTLLGDVRATRRLLDYLRQQNEIDDADYKQFKALVDKQFSAKPKKASANLKRAKPSSVVSAENDKSKSPAASGLVGANSPTEDASDETFTIKAELIDESSVDSTQAELVSTAPVGAPTNALAANAGSTARPAMKPAPWDLPDPPAPAPRRSFGELMSGFMQEKNMRWGELTSGILIVLSAVGLVVSLREELRNTIPYFSALLFMLITAAIHGAGIYTLKKWKLRNTSRGTLIIGLLLIPLNFVAACILSGGEERRALNDPWLWTAIGVGITGFSAMTWWSSKCLLRRGHWPMVAAVMGCGIGTLLINRLVERADTSLGYLFYGLPVLASFLVGTCLFERRQWVRTRWTERSVYRMYLFLGVCVFALISSLALVVIRVDAKAMGIVSLAPVFSIVCIVTSWFGSIAHRGAEGESQKTLRFSGLALKILGMILIACSLVASLSNPTMFVVNALASFVGLVAMFIHQRQEKLFPVAWAVLAAGILAALNIVIGTFGFDDWASGAQIAESVFNGKSGLCLLAVGAMVVGLNSAILKSFEGLKDPGSFKVQGYIAGGAIFLAGCLIALVASFVNREDTFDVMVASGLLMIAGVGLVAVCTLIARRGKSFRVSWLSHFATVMLLGGLAHALLWNRSIAQSANAMTGDINAAWILMFAIASVVLTGIAVFLKWNQANEREQLAVSESSSSSNLLMSTGSEADANPSSLGAHVGLYQLSFSNDFGNWGAIAAAVLSLGSLTIVSHQSGWASLFQVVACLCWFGAGWVWWKLSQDVSRSDKVSVIRKRASVGFVISTGLLVGVVVAELVSKSSWCPTFEHSKHWLIQLTAFGCWVVGWSVARVGFDRSRRFKWLGSLANRVERLVLFVLLLVVGGLVLDATFAGTMGEISSQSNWVSQFSIQSEMSWGYLAIGAIAAAIVVAIVVTPSVELGASLVLVWMLSWAFGAAEFETSRSVGSALRWLLPIGGIVGAVLATTRRKLLPAWIASRNQINLPGPSRWSSKSSQRLINFALAIVAFVVLLISTITVSQVLLNGAGSLGGPADGSWFQRMPKEISFGGPVAIVVATFLLYAISEQRSWLATLGSMVLQYIVLLSVVLLFLSPHPKLASNWFINILQSISLGMTGYGFVWFWTRDRIEGRTSRKQSDDTVVSSATKMFSQIEVHTWINGLLVTSLAALVMWQFYWIPNQSGDWISSVGSLMGIAAWGVFSALAMCIWSERLIKKGSLLTWSWLVGWMGLILLALVAAVVDRNLSVEPSLDFRLPFRLIAGGTAVVAAIQFCLVWILRKKHSNWFGNASDQTASLGVASWKKAETPTPFMLSVPTLFVGAIGLLFSLRGAWLDGEFAFYIAVMGLILVLGVAVGWLVRSAIMGFVSVGLGGIIVSVLFFRDPYTWFTGEQPYWFNMLVVSSAVLAIVWTGFYLYRRKIRHEPLARSFVLMPSLVMLFGSIWILFAGLLQMPCDSGLVSDGSTLLNPLGLTALGLLGVLTIVSVANDRARCHIVSRCLLSLGVVIGLASRFAADNEWRVVSVVLGIALTVAGWGLVWINRSKFKPMARQLGATRLSAVEQATGRELPIYSLVVGGLVLVVSTILLWNFDLRAHRYLIAMVPFALAIGLGCQSNQTSRRWMQLLTLSLVTIGCLYFAWSDLSSQDMRGDGLTRVLIRGLIVLAGAMFVYGGLVTRWVRAGDTWLKSLREMAIATCGLAIAFFMMVIASEYTQFEDGKGCGVGLGEAITVTLLVIGMIVGLMTIAVRPQNDPFALSLKGRMGYVYAAEFVGVALIAHMYFTMPFLFQIGIKYYWPFIVMVACFAGVGVAQVLEKRNLTVLGQPIFHTAAVLPLLVAGAMLLVDSKADSALVLLTIGMAYLLISFLHQSVLSGLGAVVFGNLALWVFFHRSPGFAFLDHPQLWLIPPAISALIAGQFGKHLMDAKQLAALRYVCVAVIYVSSTIEIFIVGIGDNLWPPMVLAVLSVIGIMSGIMLQIKSFLYFGSLFLLMAMITMVAHAHQRLDHVWPWWAFGVALGIGILVMFGLFEKRKKEMKAIAFRLKDWEA